MPFCTRCGREHTGDARFCAGCGTPLAPVARREERKVVTVLFADIVGSTAHAEGLDPEDVRAFLARYHEPTRHELERYVEEIGSTDLVRSHVNLGGINFQLGNLDVAHHHHRVALDLCERRGFRPYARWLVIELAQDAFAAGDWAEARRLVSSRLEAADGGASYMDVQARFLALELAVATTGVVDDDVLDSLVADAYRVADPQVVLPVLAGAARLLSRTGATERAGPLLDAFLEHAAGGNLCAWEAYVAIAAGERGRAAQLLALAERGVRSRWSHASRLAAAGDHVAAADVLASMGALSEEAGARLHAATLLAGSGRVPRGAVQAERAAAFYDEVGATWLADRARALGAAADAGLAAVSRRSDGR